ncbi:MAG: bifunctional nuclease family protein [Nitrospirae bacterium]|nr:MAG: bifunctional nuclease family protein [Nitrospirota bacterium]
MKIHMLLNISKIWLALLIGVWSIAFMGFVDDIRAESDEVTVEHVEVQFSPQGPVVLLTVGDRTVSIYVDPTVAGSIHGALTGQKFPRPLSHDLMSAILKAYEIHVDRVFITLKDGIFYGTMTLSRQGETKEFDSRSSDAIALAIHFGTPIVIPRELLDSAGEPREKEQDEDQVLL